ncbi:MAG TPA: AsmA family protein, partial [Puia sp.]|nr:AsmA family protein [Puia sp.]
MIRRLARIFLKVIATIIIILVIVIFLIQTPYVQNIIRSRAEKYLSKKLNTRVSIGNLYIKFPENVVLRNIYLEDRQRDTLLAAGLIDVNIHMWGLLHSHIDIGKVQLEGITMKVKRLLPDTAFNFQFIADAFSSPKKEAPVQKDTSSMKMSLGELQLDRVRLVYRDTVTGNNVEVWIDHSQTVMKQFDPVGMHFHVAQFRMRGLRANIQQGKPLMAPAAGGGEDTVRSAPMDLQLGKIELVDSRLDYGDAVNKLATHVQLGGLTAEVRSVDLDKQVFRVKSVELDSTDWRFDDDKQRRQKKGMDYAHLDVRGMSLHGNDLLYSADSISGVLTKGEMSEQSGFTLLELRTGFVYTAHETLLKDLLLRTPGTLLRRSLTLHYSSLAGITKDPAHTLVDLDLPDSRIKVKDVLVFAPFLASQPALAPNDIWNVDTRIRGNLDNLRIEHLRFSGLQDIRLDLSGTVLHPMDTARVAANLNIGSISGSRRSLEALLPKGALPANIVLPARFTLRGKLDGGMTGVNSDIVLTTTSGILVVKGYVQQFRDMQRARYDLAVQTRGLDLGYILKDSTQWGLVTADFAAKGRGFDVQTANAVVHGRLQSAVIRGYNYRDFLFDGNIADKHIALQSSIHDTAIKFDLRASADMANKYPAVKLDWRIDTVDMHALHFVKDTLQFRGYIHADFPSANPDSLLGRLKMDSLLLVQGRQVLTTDSILLVADHKNGIQDIQLHTEMADVDWSGRYKLTETGKALQHSINNYYRLNGYKDSAFTEQDWKMRLQFRVSPLVLAYMPSLKGTDTVGGIIYFQSRYDDRGMNISAPHIQLGSPTFEQVTVRASSGEHDDGAFRYSVDIGAGQGSGVALYKTSLHGWLAGDKLFTTLLLKDKKGKDRYRLAGQLEKLIDGLKFTLHPDSLLLNYDK